VHLIRHLLLLFIHAVLVVPGIALASSAAAAETRVGAFDLAEQSRVGLERSLTLELHQGCAARYDDLASDSLLAARGATQAIQTSERGLAHVLARHTVGGAEAAGNPLCQGSCRLDPRRRRGTPGPRQSTPFGG
jgi:hypothetical protein